MSGAADDLVLATFTSGKAFSASGNDTIRITGAGSGGTVDTGLGNDSISIGGVLNSTQISTDAGADSINFTTGGTSVSIFAGSGNDVISFGSDAASSNDSMLGGVGNDSSISTAMDKHNCYRWFG